MTVTSSQANSPLILALDVGTSSIRVLFYDATGSSLTGIEGRVTYEMQRTADGGVEIDADELLALTCRVIDDGLRQAGDLAGQIGGVGICTFWHSLLGVDADGRPVTPLYSWADTRSREDARALASRVPADEVHARTGVVPHASYQPARLLWLRRTDPDRFARVAYWMTFADYLFLQLFDRRICSVSMASGTGLFNPNTCTWDEEMVDLVGIEVKQLSPLAADDEGIEGLAEEYAQRWPALRHIPWFPAFGDGACSNIGSGCVTADRVALMVGTSGAMRVCFRADQVHVPQGLWCYRANRSYVVMGGALSNGGDVYAWGIKTLNVEANQAEEQLSRMEPDRHGLTVLPFFSGERSTGWADGARAVVAGMSLHTSPIEILRASLEAVAYRFAAIYQQLRQEVPVSNRIIASGGGILNSATWTQMMADVIGVPVAASAVEEASSRGAALLVLQALGHLGDLESLPVSCAETYDPILSHRAAYQRGFERHQRLYDQLIKNNPL